MSDIIQQLPDSVANQIAAGEVIQRPASVIKELVENAVDAGASVINVLVTDAGRTSIQVIDNGKGMSETDARLSFERHATSKIRKADDLFALHTMGFRGEALASIAAVAQVELKTRLQGNDIGTHLHIAGSKFAGQEPCSCPVGSNFLIENLFYNVPARRKFLKSNTTELNNILAAFERIVLVYPKTTFTFHSNGVEMLDLKACGLRQRIVDVFGKRLNQDLLPVKAETSLCTITGFVGKPESARKKGAKQYFFVNGRYMKHPYFHKAVMQAFDRLIPEGEQVPYFIYFDVRPEDIDVNIHPTKTEIKFENEQAIWQILMATVRESIGLYSDIPTIDFDTEGKPDIPVYDPQTDVHAPRVDINPQYNPFNAAPSSSAPPSPRSSTSASRMNISADEADGHIDTGLTPPASAAPSRVPGGEWQQFDQPPTEGWEQLYEGLSHDDTDDDTPTDGKLFEKDQQPTPLHESLIAEKSPAHYQYKGKYIMTAVKSGLMIIDQHRAHLRILYEQYISRISRHSTGAQKVLFPEIIQLSAQENITYHKIADVMRQFGFELTDMAGGSYAVNAVPAGLDGVSSVRLVHDIITSAMEKDANLADEVNRSLALSLARNAAIPQGQVLTNEEMENIVNSLFACQNANYTPDGKNILCILRQQEIEHLLG